MLTSSVGVLLYAGIPYVARGGCGRTPQGAMLGAGIDEAPASASSSLPDVPDLSLRDAATEAADPLLIEMSLLAAARRLLAEEPAEALRLCDEHAHRYARGALSEEREAYSIIALARLGRFTEAERRYVDFQAEYPASTFHVSLREALEPTDPQPR
jgi:hypothetical protein